jgi:hypothetical protein
VLTDLFQAESVREAAWGCEWVGTPVPFQRCLLFIIATANKEFTLTAGKFVPVCNQTMINVRRYSFSDVTQYACGKVAEFLEDQIKILAIQYNI